MDSSPTVEPKYMKAPTGDHHLEGQTSDENPHKRKWLSWSTWTSIPWIVEVLAWIASCCFFVGIIVALSIFDGKPLPDLRFHITPNALVGFLSTLAEVLLIVPLQSSIGQLKWLRALRTGPLDDFRALDAASRGPLGSAKLLASRVGGATAYVGAMLTILALGVNVFFQQSLDYPTKYNSTDAAVLPRAQSLRGDGHVASRRPNGVEIVNLPGVDPAMVSAPQLGLFSPPGSNFTLSDTQMQCPTGNCTWDQYTTLGVCSTCQNLASQLKQVGRDRTDYWILSNGFGLDGVHEHSHAKWNMILNMTTIIPGGNLTGGHNKFSSVFEGKGSQIVSVIAVGLSPNKLPSLDHTPTVPDSPTTGAGYGTPVAFECMLQFCVHTMQAQVANGTIVDEVVSTWVDDKHEPLLSGGKQNTLTPPGSSTTYNITPQAWDGMRQWLGDLLLGNVSLLDNSGRWLDATGQGMIQTSEVHWWIMNQMNQSDQAFPQLMKNLANAMSLNLRTTPYQVPVRGKAWSSTTNAVVTWAWLTLPLFELVASLGFLVTVILQTRRRGLQPWTNNVLASFFHGLDKRLPGTMEGQNVMEIEAQRLLIEFELNNGGRMVLVNSERAVETARV